MSNRILKRLHLATAGLFLLVASAAVISAQETAKTNQEDEFFKTDTAPKFETTSADPVTLRYAMKPGEVFQVDIAIVLDSLFRLGPNEVGVKQENKFSFTVTPAAADKNGNLPIEFKATRFQTKMTGPSIIEFDSDRPDEGNQNFKPWVAILNVGIPCKVSPAGKLLESDLEPIRAAVRKESSAAIEKTIADRTRELLEGIFIGLPDSSVKAGDTYKGAKTVRDNVKLDPVYKIRSVSGDKTMAILEPAGTVGIDPNSFPGLEVEIKKQRMGGWIRFDQNQGFANAGETRVYILMDISRDEKKGSGEMKLTTTFSFRPAKEAAKSGPEDEFFKFENAPRFETTSSDPVTFRYKFKEGQVWKMNQSSTSEALTRQGTATMEIKKNMNISAKAAITAVDDKGNISLVVKITRFQMTMSGPVNMEFDSDKPDDGDEKLKPLRAMINIGIPCKMTPTGKLLETDLEPLRLAVRRADNAAFAKMFEDSTTKMVEGTFTQLSEAPLKAGDTYKAGTVTNDKATMQVSYKIQAVSGDKSMAIVEPQGTMELSPDISPGDKVELKKSRTGGWIQFDLNKGYPPDQDTRVYMLIRITSPGEEPTTMEVRMKSTVKSTLE